MSEEAVNLPAAARPPSPRGLLLFLAALCLALASPIAVRAQAPTVQATLDRNVISVGEHALLVVTCNNFSPAATPAPVVPSSQVQFAGSGRSMSIVNGQVNQQVTFSYFVVPQNIGPITIPAITVEANGRKLATQPLLLQVVPGATAGAEGSSPSGPRSAFLKLGTGRTNVFLGEIIQTEVKLYAREGRFHQPPQLGGDGFTLSKVILQNQTMEAVDGQNYSVVTWLCTLIPIKAGDLALGPATMEFGMGGGFTPFQRVNLRSDPLPVTVRPLPVEGRPPEFNGAVGTFNIDVVARPTNVLAGDPITLSIRIGGRGNIDQARLPEQRGLADFQTYPPTSTVETDPMGQQGFVRTEWVVAPKNAAVAAIPPLVFTYFDPVKGAYASATTPAIPITVRSAPGAQIGSDPRKLDTGPKPIEIAHIRPTMGVVAPPPAPLVLQPWFWAVQSIAPLAWLAAFIYRKRREAAERDVDARRKKAVSRRVREGLAEMASLAKADDVEGFFALGFRLLQEQTGERLKITASGITESVVEERLRGRGLPEEFLALCHELFNACNNVRYAPHQSAAQLQEWIPKFESAFVELRKLK